MTTIFPTKSRTKNGPALIIREAEATDAAAMIDYVQTVSGETDFLTFGPGEFDITLEDEEGVIAAHRRYDNQVFLLAEVDGRLVGMLNVSASQKPRLRHIGEFGLTVLRAYWGQGIGAALMQAMLDWAGATGVIRKINLAVQADNAPAIRLYERFGFETEGRLRRDLFGNGTYHDAFIMGKLID